MFKNPKIKGSLRLLFLFHVWLTTLKDCHLKRSSAQLFPCSISCSLISKHPS